MVLILPPHFLRPFQNTTYLNVPRPSNSRKVFFQVMKKPFNDWFVDGHEKKGWVFFNISLKIDTNVTKSFSTIETF